MLKVMLVDANPGRRAALAQSLRQNGYDVFEQAGLGLDLVEGMAALAPDVIIIDTESPDRDMLEHLCTLTQAQPRPVVMFTDDDDGSTIRKAIRAGVTSYVVAGITPETMRPILEVAIARFQEEQRLRDELQFVRTQLAERKTIERAKGILMQRRGVTEEEAYAMLRRLAMSRRQKIAQVAEELIGVAGLLT